MKRREFVTLLSAAAATDNQVGDLDAVITQLELGQVVLVAHDASGPPAIDWALAHPERVAGLVLLNTYYCEMPTLRRPEAIWLFSTPVIRSVARPVSRMFGNWLFRRMYWWREVHLPRQYWPPSPRGVWILAFEIEHRHQR